MATLLALTSNASAQQVSYPVAECGLGVWQMCRYINPSTSTPVTDVDFQLADAFHEGRAAVRVNGLFGFIDVSGAMVIPPRYEQASRFRHGLAEVSDGISVDLINKDGIVIVATDFRRAIPISPSVFMAYIDDRKAAAKRGSYKRYLIPALWRDPRNEAVFVFSKAVLFGIDGVQIPTPPVRSIQLIPNVSGAFWLQIAEPGDGWSMYDWGLMREDGQWIIEPGIMDVVPLPNGFTLIFDPPADVEREYHDSYFGWELSSNKSGWEAVVDGDGNIVGGEYFENVGYSSDLSPLVWKDGQWFEIDKLGKLHPFDGEPESRSLYTKGFSPPQEILTVDHSYVEDNLTCANGVRLFSQPDTQPDDTASAFNLRWGLVDSDGVIIVPAKYRYITCPQHGVALVPDAKSAAWCPVGPSKQAATSSTCQDGLWDGSIRELNPQHEELDPDPFKSDVLWFQQQLLWSQFPDLVDKPKWVSGLY